MPTAQKDRTPALGAGGGHEARPSSQATESHGLIHWTNRYVSLSLWSSCASQIETKYEKQEALSKLENIF